MILAKIPAVCRPDGAQQADMMIMKLLVSCYFTNFMLKINEDLPHNVRPLQNSES